MIRNFADAVPLTHFYSWTLPPGLPPRWAQTHLELFASKVSLVIADGEFFHGGLVPGDTCAWPVRNVNRAATDLKGFRQERITPVPPFQPVRGFRDTHQMGREFRIEM